MELRADSKLSAHPDVVWRMVEGEVVLLNVTSGQYYALDPVGSRVWMLIPAEGTTLNVLCAQLAGEFDADPQTIAGDLDRLFAQLLSHQLIALT